MGKTIISKEQRKKIKEALDSCYDRSQTDQRNSVSGTGSPAHPFLGKKEAVKRIMRNNFVTPRRNR